MESLDDLINVGVGSHSRIRIPNDFQVLQTIAKTGQLKTFFSTLPDIYTKCKLIWLVLQIKYMIYHIGVEIWTQTNMLPLDDDGYWDFCAHVLSLPIDRIISFIRNPYKELTSNPHYYYDQYEPLKFKSVKTG